MASLFGITALDVQKKMVPKNGEWTFLIGDGGELSEGDCLAIIETQEDRVLSLLPDRQRRLMRRVDGEVLTRSAAGGETVLRCALAPVIEGTLRVYVDFPEGSAWSERLPADALADGEFSVVGATGVVTLGRALVKGQKVLAEYEHGAAASFLWLRELAVTFTAVEIARRFAYFQTAEGFQRFEQWEQSASLYLRDMQRQQRPGVDALERVPLLSDVRPNTWTKFFG